LKYTFQFYKYGVPLGLNTIAFFQTKLFYIPSSSGVIFIAKIIKISKAPAERDQKLKHVTPLGFICNTLFNSINMASRWDLITIAFFQTKLFYIPSSSGVIFIAKIIKILKAPAERHIYRKNHHNSTSSSGATLRHQDGFYCITYPFYKYDDPMGLSYSLNQSKITF
jgi:hypothetical protein